MTYFFLLGAIVFFLSLCLTYFILMISFKKNILDFPNDRSLHQKPIPRGGGLAFVILFYVALVFLWIFHFIQLSVFLALLCGIPIACIGYCDDLFGVRARWRALIQVASAMAGLAILGVASSVFYIFAVFVTVWFTNLYNFMDGVDGLAGTQAIFVSAAAGSMLYFLGQVGVAYVCFSLTFSVLGFLVFNWPPAKIFMGDAGSGFLGYLFAMLMWITNNQHALSISTWWILFAVFLSDASFTLIYRLLQKKTWYEAHREHAYQRLVQSGISHRRITLGILCVNVIICLPLAEFSIHLQYPILILYATLIFSGFWLIWFTIIRKRIFLMRVPVNDQS